MKRMHIHVGVEDLEKGIQFYSALFAEKPTKTKDDYAKWLLEDPRINFAISTRAGNKGVDHLGLQVEREDELTAIRQNLTQAEIQTHDDGETVCCYSRSEKSWVSDPAGVAWETYQTMDDAEIFSEKLVSADSSCCVPESRSSCC